MTDFLCSKICWLFSLYKIFNKLHLFFLSIIYGTISLPPRRSILGKFPPKFTLTNRHVLCNFEVLAIVFYSWRGTDQHWLCLVFCCTAGCEGTSLLSVKCNFSAKSYYKYYNYHLTNFARILVYFLASLRCAMSTRTEITLKWLSSRIIKSEKIGLNSWQEGKYITRVTCVNVGLLVIMWYWLYTKIRLN